LQPGNAWTVRLSGFIRVLTVPAGFRKADDRIFAECERLALAMEAVIEAPQFAAGGRDDEIEPIAVAQFVRRCAGFGAFDLQVAESDVTVFFLTVWTVPSLYTVNLRRCNGTPCAPMRSGIRCFPYFSVI
jgi:hypothetical protein